MRQKNKKSIEIQRQLKLFEGDIKQQFEKKISDNFIDFKIVDVLSFDRNQFFFWFSKISSWRFRRNTIEIAFRVFLISSFVFFLCYGRVDARFANFFTYLFFFSLWICRIIANEIDKSHRRSDAMHFTHFSKFSLTRHNFWEREQFYTIA